MRQLVEALRAGQVQTLICAGGNASYASAGSDELRDLIRRVPQSVYLGLYENETARDCGCGASRISGGRAITSVSSSRRHS